MLKKSIKKNYIYNVLYQILTIMIPLITTPYISRILEADGVGTVSYIRSVETYFGLVAALGISKFGQREISYVQDDKEKRTEIFWNVCVLQLITSSIAIIAYIIFSIFQKNMIFYLVLSFNLVSIMIDITWFFQGIEQFGKIVLRNIIIKGIEVIFIFGVVHDRGDMVWYMLGPSLLGVISNLTLWFYLPEYVFKPCISKLRPFFKFKIVLSLFIPNVAISLYIALDKIMLGIIAKNSFENGYYEQAIKISKITIGIITALGTVMIPRIGYYYGKRDFATVKGYMYRSYRFVWFLGIPLCFGLIGIAENFVPWFLGQNFMKVTILLSILGFLIPVIGLSNVTGTQYLISTERQNLLTLSVMIGAGCNIILNIILIPKYQSIGAAIATLIAEAMISVSQLIMVRKELSVKKVCYSICPYLFASVVMFVVLKYINSFLSPTYKHTIVMIISGTVIYFFLIFILRDDFFMENIRSVLLHFRKKGK